jgi:hypothetical protein
MLTNECFDASIGPFPKVREIFPMLSYVGQYSSSGGARVAIPQRVSTAKLKHLLNNNIVLLS